MKLWAPNQLLDNGRFIIQKVLGMGGFGVTYSAIEQDTGKLFAIKTLNPIQQNQEDFHQLQVKFVNEALRLAKCSHPHIVQVYEVIQEDELWGMVMEYIDGKDLGIYVDQRGQLPEDEALRYIDQVGQALEYVHQQGFLHRDVKPNNIILYRRTKEAVLIDFGLAREYTLGRLESMTNDRTNGYAPIEQYDRKGIFAPYTDVYALAATLYSLLTKVIPCPANYRNQGLLLPPNKYNSQISDRVNDAILEGMALAPEDRPQSVLEFREILGIASTSPPNPKSKPLGEQGTPPPNSHRKPLGEELFSSVGMDYSRLRDLLVARKWKEADEETARVMLAVAGRENPRSLRLEDIDTFPYEDLRTIDQLWVKHSNGRFGFSVQKRIYQGLGGTREYNREIWEAFGDRIGWRKDNKWMYYNEATFDLKAPVGHLPGAGYWGINDLLSFNDCGSLLTRRDL
ncbi:serine/threonine protein kinase [Cylindrospermum stagnale PCC 7417]|uniref:Serine/threonine protein kinase n=1 Tax=Cylindrospermum stagnale PCC 7417 TaxID=56107 RepID=K9WTW5_9NOST|nr:serine/threonine-protein kinase [Cylindrospermum stagnale]AFZ23216.1 serine/threonine protein kinase [Cylindrospermum stagnale PCC 7417]